MKWTRRSLLKAGTGLAVLPPIYGTAQSRPPKTRLILLGTAGGPSPKKSRAAPAQVIVHGDSAYVVDCGNGVARQLVLADIPLRSIRHLFVTHHHSDHNADYGTLLLLAWNSGLSTRVDTWGPPPLERITKLFLEMSAPDIAVRQADEGKPSLGPLIHTHELTAAGLVTEDRGIRIRCALVDHPLVKPALAYRFDAPNRSIVISGDTAKSDKLIALARKADVLVHEVLYPPAIDALAGKGPGSAELRKHLVNSHTSLEDAGEIAAKAQVGTLVLSHFVPGETPLVNDETWLAGARKHFAGRIIVGRDLLEV